jgi:hypothetical protein
VSFFRTFVDSTASIRCNFCSWLSCSTDCSVWNRIKLRRFRQLFVDNQTCWMWIMRFKRSWRTWCSLINILELWSCVMGKGLQPWELLPKLLSLMLPKLMHNMGEEIINSSYFTKTTNNMIFIFCFHLWQMYKWIYFTSQFSSFQLLPECIVIHITASKVWSNWNLLMYN